MTDIAQRDSERFIRSFDPFTASSMSGEADVLPYAPTGKLDPQYVRLFRMKTHAYVVWSHGTPIAWADETDTGWTYTMPPDGYSQTTRSKHLPHVHRAWRLDRCSTPTVTHEAHGACPGRI
jgi:hypothetical protein